MAADEDVEDSFRPFTKQSLADIEERIAAKQGQAKRKDGEGPQPDPTLAQGRRLPARLRIRYPGGLAAKAIEDIDPFYQNQRTFVVINKWKYISRFSATNALWILDPFHAIRRLLISTLVHPFFSIFMVATVLTNCFFLIMPSTPVIEGIELIFLGIYTLELVVKVMARGFVLQPFTYLRDSWNWLDLFVIVTGYLSSELILADRELLGMLRMLRALKIVPLVPGIRTMVGAVKESAKNLRDVFIMILYFLFLVALLGLQIYMGILTQICIRDFPSDGSWGDNNDENWLEFVSNSTNWFEAQDDYPLCGNSSGAGACPPGYTCLQGYTNNPNYGYTNFDTFGWASLSAIRLITRDYWENLYQLVQRAAGPWHMLFFIPIIFLGSFYLVNCLVFAIIAMSYSNFHKRQEEEESAEKEAIKKEKEEALTNRRRLTAATPNGEQVRKESSLDGEDGDTKAKDNPFDNPFVEPTRQQSTDDVKDVVVLGDKQVTGGETAARDQVDYYFSTEEDDEGKKSKGKLQALCSKITDMFCVWDCCWPWVKFQQIVGMVALSPFFELFIMLIIMLNTFFMALDHHDMNRDMEIILRRGNYVFTLIFIIEAILKIIAMSPKYYFKNSWNRFDFTIVAMSLVELGLEGVQGLSVLRSFRLLRILRLAKWWPSMNAFMASMGRTSKALKNLTFVLALFFLVFAGLGMHMFGRNYIENYDLFPDYDLPRWNFTDFIHSFMVVFRAVCGEWIESMWDCMLVGDATCIPFFLAIVIIGNLIVLNLFVAFLISGLVSSNQPDPQEDNEAKKIGEAFSKIGRFLNCITCNVAKLVRSKTSEHRSADAPGNPFGQEQSNLQRKSFQLIENKYFRMAIIATILLGCLSLALGDVYSSERPTLLTILYIIDIIFTVILFLEMIIRLLALGCKKYFTNIWCWLDFIIIMVSVINLAAVWAPINSSAFSCIAMLCALRPLMIISRCEPMRVVVDTLMRSTPSILKLLVVCSIFWLIFAIMGVQLFAGKFFKCVDENGTVLSYQYTSDRNECLTKNYAWENSAMNFDHIGNAFLCLFQVASFKGWLQIMNDAVDSTWVHKQPVREINIYMYLYFVSFIIFGSFFTLNQIMLVVIDYYNDRKKEAGGALAMFMTDRQKKRYNEMKSMKSETPQKAIPRPTWKPQAIIYDICTNKKFDIIIMVLICCYALMMTLDHYQQTETLSFILDIANLIAILIFMIECLMKIFALRHHYFKDPWNIFDFVVVILSIIGVVLSDLIEKYFVSPLLLRLARLARVGLVLRLVKRARGLRTLLSTMAVSLPALFNVCLLFTLVTFVYALFGMNLFMHLKEKSGVDDVFNFRTVGQSMILLFQISTSAGWDGVLDAIINEDDCRLPDGEVPGNCGSRAQGITFMLSYLIITFIIVVNMLVAIVLEHFSQASEDDEEDPNNDDR
ncbi:sodium channel protein para-like [Ischnura elegans]|uniref:sodium channel protein para-like n=1 Tax=Ischnura elegans TaxID=197161 RepID=UPI001ED87051|nr:sodium channel protein para-like [Ischnura elegans]